MGADHPANGVSFARRSTLEAFKGERTVSELAAEYGVHPTMIHQWKPPGLPPLICFCHEEECRRRVGALCLSVVPTDKRRVWGRSCAALSFARTVGLCPRIVLSDDQNLVPVDLIGGDGAIGPIPGLEDYDRDHQLCGEAGGVSVCIFAGHLFGSSLEAEDHPPRDRTSKA